MKKWERDWRALLYGLWLKEQEQGYDVIEIEALVAARYAKPEEESVGLTKKKRAELREKVWAGAPARLELLPDSRRRSQPSGPVAAKRIAKEAAAAKDKRTAVAQGILNRAHAAAIRKETNR